MQGAYAELVCRSHYSFLQATSSPAQLVARAAQLGYRALALTDDCSLSGVVAAHQAAAQYPQLKLIIGSRFQLQDLSGHLVLLVTDRPSYAQLCRLISGARRRAPKGQYQLARQDLEREGLGQCLAIWLPGALSVDDAHWLKQQFPERVWLGLGNALKGDDEQQLMQAQAWARYHQLPCVACGDVRMHQRSEQALLDVMSAIRQRCTVEALGHRRQRNAERHLRSLSQLAALLPAPCLQESLRIAERCRFSLDELRYEYPEEVVPEGLGAGEYLRRETLRGAERRWPEGIPERLQQQIEHELALIGEQRYEAYFLTVYDLVRFARGRGILCQGRGSAANSVVCYCLGITSVDPEQVDLLFERFISRARDEPPDIDVDFEHQRREEVVQYLYQKYGRERTALTATLITYRTRSALRDVGKALGLEADQLDTLVAALGRWSGLEQAEARWREVGFDTDSAVLRLCLNLAQRLRGKPRHLSQHVGGFVIARGRLDELVPIENAAMPERTVIQWEKDDLEALGLMKVDVLALGMLTALRKCFALVAEHHGRDYDLARVPREDAATYALLQRADSVGVFQVESRAQMAMLPRLRPRCFYDLVVQVAIVRPGPIQGDMVHPYLQRRADPASVCYPSEDLRDVLGPTLGVPIFQEQVMKVAMVAAGFSAEEADQLRRSMAAWKRRGGLAPFEEKLTRGMLARGYTREFAERIFAQIKGFGDYGFPESHAASFALLAYISSYLKCHYPAAFCCALLNSQPMGFYRPAQLLADARRHGVEVLAVDVQHSAWAHDLARQAVGDPALRLGLCLVKGLCAAVAERIGAARRVRAFADVQDLAQRAALSQAELENLAAAGALASLSGDRHRAFWAAAAQLPASPLALEAAPEPGAPLLPATSDWQEVSADYAHTGLSLGPHPMALLRERLRAHRVLSAEALRQAHPGQVVRVAGVVIARQRPGTATGVVFVTLEDETGNVNIIIWPQHAEVQRRALLNARILQVNGVLQKAEGVIHVVAGRLYDGSGWLPETPDFHPRDFH